MGDVDGGDVVTCKSGLPGGVAVSPKELSEPRRLKLNTSSESAAGGSMRCWLSQPADTWIDGGGACGCQTLCEGQIRSISDCDTIPSVLTAFHCAMLGTLIGANKVSKFDSALSTGFYTGQ